MESKGQVIDLHKLLKDADGFVHTSKGFISGAEYDRIQAKHPRLLPLRSEIPLMTEANERALTVVLK